MSTNASRGAPFLGNGWSFDVTEGVHIADGAVAEDGGEEKIRQSMFLILSTSPGERIGRPEFGCGIHDLVFSVRSHETLARVREAVHRALTRWEPRVDVLAVKVEPDPDVAHGLLIFVHYQVRATNARGNLVYPFYLST